MTVRQANETEYRKLVSSLRFVFKNNSYINKDYLKQDLKNGSCYVVEDNGKIVAIGSLVYDSTYKMYYIKRVSVPNKRKRSKGYAKELIQTLKDAAEVVAVTPWKDNIAMQKILEQVGFKYNYTFQENYMLYTSV